jgi:hypothetical protein
MCVELGVETSAGVLTKHANHDPLRVDTHDMSVNPHPSVRMILDPAHDPVHRSLMSGDHLIPDRLVTKTEQDRHRLGCREGGIETPDRGLALSTAEILSGGRMLAVE